MILKAYDEHGELLHDCEASGCDVSYDGYAIATGERLEGATDLGDQWDVIADGVARRKPSSS